MKNSKLDSLISVRRVLANNQKLNKSFSKNMKDTHVQKSLLLKDIDLEFAYSSAQECIQKFIGSRAYNITPTIGDNKEKVPVVPVSHSPVNKHPKTIRLFSKANDKTCIYNRKLKSLMHTRIPRKFKVWRKENAKISCLFDESIRRSFQIKRLQPIKGERQRSMPSKKFFGLKDSKPWMYSSDSSGIFRLSTSKTLSKNILD